MSRHLFSLTVANGGRAGYTDPVKAAHVSVLSGDDDGELTVSNRDARFDVSALGFFGVTPGERQGYLFDPSASPDASDCELAPLGDLVRTLVNELSLRGLVKPA